MTVKVSLIVAILCCIFAFSLVENKIGYIFVPIIFLVSKKGFLKSASRPRFLLFWLTIFLAFYGTLLGIMNGHKLSYIIRFSGPFLAYAIFLSARPTTYYLFEHRRFVNIIGLFFTIFVFIITKSGMTNISLAVLQGWTLTFSTTSAIGLWHYFLLSVSATIIFDFFSSDHNKRRIFDLLTAILNITLLFLLTNTGAFTLAVLIMTISIFFHGAFSKLFLRIVTFVFLALALDYLLLNFSTGFLLSRVETFAAGDAGNATRFIQITYFVSNVKVWGHGFGAEHNFLFFENPQREVSYELFPYASELPILNIIHGSGVFGAAWLLAIFAVATRSLILSMAKNERNRVFYFWGWACNLVLVGSISNPFLFSPICMLMLAMSFNTIDAPREKLKKGTTIGAS